MGYEVAIKALAYLATVLVFYSLYNSVQHALRKDLSSLPGPWFARFSVLYRIGLVGTGQAPKSYRKIHERYGKIVRVGPNHVSVSDPSMINPIYGVGSKFLKTPFYTTMAPYYQNERMDSMFTTRDNDYHKAIKQPVAQLFSMTNMRNYEPHADKCSAIFLKAMEDLEGTSIDLAHWLQWYAFDVIASITFQRRFGFLEERKDIGGMIKALNLGLNYIGIIGQIPEWDSLIKNFFKRVAHIQDPLHSFVQITEEEIKRYDSDQGQTERTDFLAQLRARETKNGPISHRDIVNHLSNNLLAGSDTTAISLRACFYYLIKTPHAKRKLIAEIDEAEVHGRLSTFITYEECLQLPYLQCVMKEAMRLHPGVGFPLERYVPAEGASVCGVYLSGGTNVSMSAPVVHCDKQVFGQDAAVFRPERWQEASPEQIKLMDRSLLTFGAGARTCVGKNISIMEMGKFIPQVFRQFDVNWASDKEEWALHAAWFWKQSDIIVRFKSRAKPSHGT